MVKISIPYGAQARQIVPPPRMSKYHGYQLYVHAFGSFGSAVLHQSVETDEELNSARNVDENRPSNLVRASTP